jgi:hypothetical protein
VTGSFASTHSATTVVSEVFESSPSRTTVVAFGGSSHGLVHVNWDGTNPVESSPLLFAGGASVGKVSVTKIDSAKAFILWHETGESQNPFREKMRIILTDCLC